MRDKNMHFIPRWCRALAAAALLLLVPFLLVPQGVLAADGSGDWRPTYDLALRWINFGILVFLIIRYARKPLVNFFKEKSEDVRKEIRAVEQEKEEILARVDEILKTRDHSMEKLEKLKERIMVQGTAKKERIIEDAQKESKMMLESAQRKIESKMMKAQEDIRAEMIDHAFEMAMQRLPAEMKDQDSQKLYEQYLEGTKALSGH